MTYTRDFLLSFRELEACKSLPGGLNSSILREFNQAFNQACNSPSSSTNDSVNSSQDSNGKQGSASSWWRIRDGKLDKERRSDGHVHHSKQNLWHDELLRTGNSPKVFGSKTGVLSLTPKFQAEDHYQLSKSNNPYRPPCSYKEVLKTGGGITKEASSSNGYLNKQELAERKRALFDLVNNKERKTVEDK
ncbi:hypothetical protein NMG60_11022242 [Bertholletia excelsa]